MGLNDPRDDSREKNLRKQANKLILSNESAAHPVAIEDRLGPDLKDFPSSISKEVPLTPLLGAPAAGFVEKIRLKDIRKKWMNEILSLEDVVSKYQSWVETDEYLILEGQESFVFKEDYPLIMKNEHEFRAFLCSKRGNRRYALRTKDRMQTLTNLVDKNDIQFFDPKALNMKTRCIFVTLTWDSKLCSKQEAWWKIGKDFNRYMSNLRRNYGDCHIFRAWESFEKGYPHIHALILFTDSLFNVFKDRAGEFRIRNKPQISKYWHSFVDVSAVSTFSKSVYYLSKYLSKTHSRGDSWIQGHLSKGETTLAMLWVNRKRAFAISKKLLESLGRKRLDISLRNSNIESPSSWSFVKILSRAEASRVLFDESALKHWSFPIKWERVS